MKQAIEQTYLLSVLEKLINTPSPVGYYEEVNPLLTSMANELGYEVFFDRKHTGYIKVEGKDTARTTCIGTHLDTLGLMVRKIDDNGMIRTRNLGGINYNNIEGETVTVITRGGKRYTGMMACQSHSVHVFDDARELQRNENTMILLLDEKVSSKKEVKDLGIEHGDYIYIEPHYTMTPSGYIKSRFIDNKASVACSLAVLKDMKDNNLKPDHNLLFAFPHYEEVGHGGSYIPEGVDEYLAVDIAVLGPDHNGNEHSVTICVKDNFSPYDRDITDKLIQTAKDIEIPFEVDVFYRYGSDASAAVRAGNNVRHGAMGMGTLCSHGVERTHVSAVVATAELLRGYIIKKK